MEEVYRRMVFRIFDIWRRLNGGKTPPPSGVLDGQLLLRATPNRTRREKMRFLEKPYWIFLKTGEVSVFCGMFGEVEE